MKSKRRRRASAARRRRFSPLTSSVALLFLNRIRGKGPCAVSHRAPWRSTIRDSTSSREASFASKPKSAAPEKFVTAPRIKSGRFCQYPRRKARCASAPSTFIDGLYERVVNARQKRREACQSKKLLE